MYRRRHAEPIFGTDSNYQFVDERISFPLYLGEGSHLPLGQRRTPDGFLGPGRSAPNTNGRSVRRCGLDIASAGQHRDGHFNSNRVDRICRDRIGREVLLSGVLCGRKHARYTGEIAEIERVESGAEVNEKGIINRACEYRYAVYVKAFVRRGIEERLIVKGAWADVIRYYEKI